jgi:TetR/AcrR family transcriptional regulator, transcriptional repressor for nem operon
MPRDGTATRSRILDAAEALVLDQGFAGTSVDDVIAAAETTKGGFFHHFPTKQELAHALVERYVAADMELLDSLLEQAEQESDDPLDQLLRFVSLQDVTAELDGETPGCLYASFCYEQELVDETTRSLIADAMLAWRTRTRAKLDEVAARYPPRVPVDLDALADQGLAVYEGTFVLSRALGEPELLRGQLHHFRTYLELLFRPA